jgi:hypothetical protein
MLYLNQITPNKNLIPSEKLYVIFNQITPNKNLIPSEKLYVIFKPDNSK